MKLRNLIILAACIVIMTSAAKEEFTALEKQQISIPTPGLFEHADAFSIDFGGFRSSDYSFPLPVGKAVVKNNSELEITTDKGDAVKAMFAGTVRISKHISGHGNVIVIRHDNGLETVYARNAENLVKVGDRVKAGQTIAIVGTKEGETYCEFSIMVNGARINPETIIELKSHKLRRQTVQFRKTGSRINITVIGGKDSSVSRNDKSDRNVKGANKKSGSRSGDHAMTLDPDEVNDPFTITNTFLLDLEKIEEKAWSYPLPDARVISPYGGARRHSGVDLKTKPNDEIYAAFDGEVVASGPYYGYGNCIRIKHAYGLETLYSHQSKNMVKKGDKVKAGQVIGLTGRTGRATTEHLHFEVSFGGKRLDPAIIFDHSNHKLKAATLHLTKGKGVKSVKN